MKSSSRKQNRPIGVFDSGLGGLTVVHEIRRLLPAEPIVYFGDIARLPYGIKSERQIREFSLQNTRFLLSRGVKAVVVACNSSSSAAFGLLKRRFRLPVVDVIGPACERAVAETRSGRIGVMATQATIQSGVYERTLKRLRPGLEVKSQACPLLVPLVEEGWLEDPVTDRVLERYLGPLQAWGMDTLILGCTHYPLVKPRIAKAVGDHVRLVDSAGPTVDKLASLLRRKGLSYPRPGRGRLTVFVSDLPRNFLGIGERFLGEKLGPVKVIRSW